MEKGVGCAKDHSPPAFAMQDGGNQPIKEQTFVMSIFSVRPRSGIFAFALLAAALFAALMPFQPAKAQYPCNGPGPGERMVGMTQGGNGVAGVPLCVREEAAEPVPQGPPTQWVNSYYVAAWHPEASDVWTAAGYRSADAAGNAALAACTAAMGSGCTLTPGAANGSIAIARDGLGTLWAATGASDGKAKKEVEKVCLKEQAICEVFNTTNSPAWVEEIGNPISQAIVFPPKGNFHRIYGSTAWVDGDTTGDWGAKVWVNTGYSSGKEAETAAVTQCERDSGAKCKVVRTVSDAVLTIAVDATRAIRVGSSPDYRDARKHAEQRCKDAGTKCTVTASFDAAQKGAFVQDAYQALADKKK